MKNDLLESLFKTIEKLSYDEKVRLVDYLLKNMNNDVLQKLENENKLKQKNRLNNTRIDEPKIISDFEGEDFENL
jgi:hypothetical protein